MSYLNDVFVKRFLRQIIVSSVRHISVLRYRSLSPQDPLTDGGKEWMECCASGSIPDKLMS